MDIRPARIPVRTRLMKAIETQLEENAYEDITISMLTTEAGVSRQAFYKYFTNKDNLCLQMLDYICNTQLRMTGRYTWRDYVRHHLAMR